MLVLGVTVLASLSVFPGLADLGAAVSTCSDEDRKTHSHSYMAAISGHTAVRLGDFRK